MSPLTLTILFIIIFLIGIAIGIFLAKVYQYNPKNKKYQLKNNELIADRLEQYKEFNKAANKLKELLSEIKIEKIEADVQCPACKNTIHIEAQKNSMCIKRCSYCGYKIKYNVDINGKITQEIETMNK